MASSRKSKARRGGREIPRGEDAGNRITRNGPMRSADSGGARARRGIGPGELTHDEITRREMLARLGGSGATAAISPALSLAALAGSALPSPAAVEGTPFLAERIPPGPVAIELLINGAPRKLTVEPRTTLLSAIRIRLDLTGTKQVCDRGACGGCTVLVDGRPVNSCLMLALDARGKAIRTIEGLARGATLDPVQAAFVEKDALMCGYCTPGMIMSVRALLDRNRAPTLDDVRRATAGNLCRCGTYPKVFEAALAAAKGTRGTGRS